MNHVRKYFTTIVASLSIAASSLAVAAHRATFSFDHFTPETTKQCRTMSLDKIAKGIRITADLSRIQDKFTGVPEIASSSLIVLSPRPEFFFMGLKDKYAYMSRGTSAVIQDKFYHDVTFSLLSRNAYTEYQAGLRLNDSIGNVCVIALKQSS